MKTIETTKTVELNQLTTELFAAFPDWRHEGLLGRMETTVSIVEKDGTVTVNYPDATDAMAVKSVIDAHTPDPNFGVNTQLRDDIAALRTVAEGSGPLLAAQLTTIARIQARVTLAVVRQIRGA